jgi:hypothetical protein
MPRDSEWTRWRERWLRRGELLTVAAFTASLAAAANDKWLPLAVALAATVVGVYAICAAEAGWWLPGRKAARERAQAQWVADLLPEGGGTSADATAVVTELRRLNHLLERFAAAENLPDKADRPPTS